MTGQVYPGSLDPPRVKAVLAEVETGLRSPRTEDPLPGGLENLDVDHILPTSWFDFWPLPDGSKALASEAREVSLALGETVSERLDVIGRRENAKTTIGNLTLLHYGVNRSLQNREFTVKREKLFQESNLHLNRVLMLREHWDEAGIAERGQMLFDVAVRLWRRPES